MWCDMNPIWLARQILQHLGQHLLIPCFLSPGENLASEGGRLLLIVFILYYFDLKTTLHVKVFWSLVIGLFIGFCPSSWHSVHIEELIKWFKASIIDIWTISLSKLLLTWTLRYLHFGNFCNFPWKKTNVHKNNYVFQITIIIINAVK